MSDPEPSLTTSYIGHYRTPPWVLLALAGATVGCGICFLALTQDSTYAALVTYRGPFASLLRIPRPVLLVLSPLFAAALGYFSFKLSRAVILGERAFVIDESGVRQFPLLSNQEKFLAWRDIEKFTHDRGERFLHGIGPDGKKVMVGLSLLGHDKAEVFKVICRYRPDLKPDLQ